MIRAKTLVAKQKTVYDKEDFKAYFCDFWYAITKFGVL
jgi:hypothetical protein